MRWESRMDRQTSRRQQEPGSGRHERLESAAACHDELPDDIRESQVAKVEEALDLLGDEDEMVSTAVEALDRNLTTVGEAISDGADLAQSTPNPCDPDPTPRYDTTPDPEAD